jgi:hypothetical protein
MDTNFLDADFAEKYNHKFTAESTGNAEGFSAAKR